MSSEHSAEEQSIREQVEKSEHVLDNLQADLRSIDAELKGLAQRNPQYELLEQVCRSLEELDELDARHLFWGREADADDSAEQVRKARRRVDKFGEEIARVEERRESVVNKINDQNVTLDYLHYDLRDAMEREESRRNEWLVERDEDQLPNRAQVMPWTRGCEEDERFRRSLGASMAASIAIAILISMIALPIVERETVNELPERVAKLVRQDRTPPPPPAPIEEPIIPEEEIPDPDPELAEEQPPDELPEQPILADVPQPDTKEQVKSKGILAFRDSFADRANMRPIAQLGSQASLSSAGEDAVGRPERMMVTTSAPGSSGGINLSSISRNVGGGGQGIEGVQLARVASSIGGGDGPDRPLAGGAMAGRTDEEIQIVFDRYKAALYRIYNRELRKDPTLRGQLVLQLTIEPDGSVSLCKLHSSDMNAPVLAQQVVQRVLTFDFGAKEDIVAMTIIYPIDFLPAA
ncbi:MAG: AgmX/PglI C-terminal domain-containing protein [Woeseiaceae bacterium]